MRLKFIAACCAVAIAAPAIAQPAAQPPKLVVAISIDQFAADLYDEYQPHFTGGLKRLSSGVAFRNGYQSHGSTETCPGHSTILTGQHPSATGIVANSWYDPTAARTDKTVYCVEDERVSGSTSTNYTPSAFHLRALTLGDRMKAVSPASRNVAIAGKDRSAIAMGGHNVDQRWFWNGKTFATDLASNPVPNSVIAFNRALAVALATERPPLDPPPFCQSKAQPYTLAPGMVVGDGRLARAANDARGFRRSPELDGATLALAAALTTEMRLGRGPVTDLLSIGLSATDPVGHAYGNGGMEMCLQLFALDRELGDFLARLDETGIDYSVILTADHGAMDIPERLRAKGVTGAARADPALAATEVGKLLAPKFNLTGSALAGSGLGGDVWIDAAVPATEHDKVLRAAQAAYAAHPQVHAAYRRDEIAAVPPPTGSPVDWTILQRLRASYDGKRSGDLFIVLKQYVNPAGKPSDGYASGHGNPWDYDRRVPILFWRKGMPGLALDTPVETTDILPTLAATIGLAVDPGSIDGHCLVVVAGDQCPSR